MLDGKCNQVFALLYYFFVVVFFSIPHCCSLLYKPVSKKSARAGLKTELLTGDLFGFARSLYEKRFVYEDIFC